MSTILVTGSSGFLGRSVIQALAALGEHIVIPLPGRHIYDLRLPAAMHDALADYAPDTVVHLAYPGTDGIQTMEERPADLVHQLLQIDLSVIHACARHKVTRLITMGSVCSYPREIQVFPTDETELWRGRPEQTNAAYGEAKRMQLELLRSYRRQYGLQGIQLILSNLYGPGDRSGHVIPALIRRIQALRETDGSLVVWGTGQASREFLYVTDAARAVALAATCPVFASGASDHMNICSGEEVRLDRLVQVLQTLLGSAAPVTWDTTKPEGQPRRRFSFARARRHLGWTPTVRIEHGLFATVQWWQDGGPAGSDPTGVRHAGQVGVRRDVETPADPGTETGSGSPSA